MVPLNRHHCIRRIAWMILTLAFGGGSFPAHAQTDRGEPVSIQRILVNPAHVAKEMEKVQQGTLIPWPLKKFEASLDRIQKAMQAREAKPRLTQAKYSATLVGSTLAQGNGQWSIHSSGPDALLPIDALSIALAKMRWQEGNDALLGEFDGKALSLLVPRAGNGGTQMCYFDWSARGVPGSDGLAFSLALPPCPITSLDLKLPTEHWLAASKDSVLVEGPLDAGSSTHRLWKVHAAGQTQIDLIVRKISEPKGPDPTLFARVQSVQSLERDRVTLTHEFQVDILHGSISELVLESDHALQPIDVTIRSGEVKRWQWIENARKKDAKGKSVGVLGTLKIEFHQPVQGKLHALRVRSLAKTPTASEWVSPELRVRNAIMRGESLQLQFHPEFRLGKWDAGTFQQQQISTDIDGRQTLTLADTAANADTSRRPTIRLEHTHQEVHTKEHYHWQINPDGAIFNADINYLPSRGTLFELAVKLPRPFLNYSIEALELLPEDMLRSWHLQGDMLIVELKNALMPTKNARLKIRFRNHLLAVPTGARTLAFPDVEPLDVTRREGNIAFYVDPGLQAQLLNSSLPTSGNPKAKHDAIQRMPSFQFAFRDQRFTATMRVKPIPAEVRARGEHTVRLSDAPAILTSRWEFEPLTGTADFLDFQGPPGFPFTWKYLADESTLKLHHWERLHMQEAAVPLLFFGVPNSMQAAVLHAVMPAGPRFRFHLQEPLRTSGSLTIQAIIPRGISEDDWRRLALQMPNHQPWERLSTGLATDVLPTMRSSKHWRVPLMTPLQYSTADHEILVQSAHDPIEKLETRGFDRVSATTLPNVQSPLSALSVHASSRTLIGQPEMALVTRSEKHPASLLEFCDDASVTTFIRKDGHAIHRVQFRLWHWRDRNLSIGFTAGCRLIAARVHDHWLDQLNVKDDSKGVRLTLPFDQNTEFVRYELFMLDESVEYFMPGMLNARLPLVDWPIVPLQLKTRLCLAKDWAPLQHATLASIGTPQRIADSSGTWRWLHSFWTTGRSWMPFAEPRDLAKRDQQRRAVLDAAAQFRNNLARPMKFGEALESFTLHVMKDQCPLVLDQTSLRLLGLTPETPVSANLPAGKAFWEPLGLVYVPCDGVALLTSPKRVQQFGIDDSIAVELLNPALREAILHGQDSSASFATVVHWLKSIRSDEYSAAYANRFAVSEYTGEFEEMTQWRVFGDPSREIQVTLIDGSTAQYVGWIIAACLAIALVLLHRKLDFVACTRLELLLLTFSVLLAIWAPGNVREFLMVPGIGVQIVLMLWGICRLLRQDHALAASRASTVTKQTANFGAMLLLLSCVGYGANAQPAPPRVYAVLIIDAKEPLALLTPDLIAKLDEVENHSSTAASAPVLLAAKYEGHVQDDLARFDAIYDLHAGKDQDTLVLPLSGVQLLDQTLLDGTLVYPTVQKNSYIIPIRGKGPHQLRLSFTARVTPSNEYLDLRFSVPKLAINQVTLRWRKPVQAAHCLYCWGEEQRTLIENAAISKWEGQLGYESVVHLRWPGASMLPGANAIEVKEAHYWDLRPDTLGLTSSLHYEIGKNSLAQLNVALPEGLHIRAIEVQTIYPATLPAPISIKNWRVSGKGAQRRLIVEFVQPISGNVALQIETMPQTIAVQKQMSLPLPAPLQGKSVFGMLGYRLDATELRTTVQNLAVQSLNVADFEQAWKKQNPRSPIATPSRAYNFQRKSQQAGLELIIQPNVRQAAIDLNWKIDLHHADLIAKVTVTSPYEDVTLLEFFVDPGLTLADVIGPDVYRWSLHESNLQVWVRTTTKRTTLELVGWRALPYQAKSAAKQSFPLPCVYPLNMQNLVGVVAIEAEPGIEIHTERLRRLQPQGAEKHQYQIEGTPFDAFISMSAPKSVAAAQTLTKIERTEHFLEFTQGLRIATERGSVPAFTVLVNNPFPEPFTLSAPGATVVRLKSKIANTAAWSVKYPPGSPQVVALTLRGRIEKASFSQGTLPTVELLNIPIEASYLIWKDVECAAADSGRKIISLGAVKDDVAKLQSVVGLQKLAGWNLARAPKSLRVTLPTSVPRANVRVMLARQSIQQDDRLAWVYSMECWAQSAVSTELRMRFPAKVGQLGVWIDGHMTNVRNLNGNEYRMPLPPQIEPHYVEVRWTYQAERATAPRMAPMTLDLPNAPSESHFLWIPPGLVAGEEQKPTVPTLLEHLLDEAEAHLQITARLASDALKPVDNPTKRILSHQQQFYACLQQADYTAKAVSTQGPEIDATKRIDALRRKNEELAKERGYERQRENAVKIKSISWSMSRFRDSARIGIPWKVEPNQPGPRLLSAQSNSLEECRTHTEWVLLIAVFLLVFSYFRHSISLLSKFTPEVGLALIFVAAWLGGVGIVGLLAGIFLAAIRFYRLRNAWLHQAAMRNPGTDARATVKAPQEPLG